MESDLWSILRNKYFIIFLSALIMFTAIAVGLAQYVDSISKSVVLNDDGKVIEFMTMENTVDDILKKYNIELSPYDEVVPSRDKKLEKTNEITIKRATMARIRADNDIKTVHLLDGTVEDVLKKADIELGKDDLVSHELTTPLSPGLFITVNRITEEIITEDTQRGFEGADEKKIKVVYKDGEEISRELLEETITEKVQIPSNDSSTKKAEVERKVKVAYKDGEEASREVLEETITEKVPIPYKEVVKNNSQLDLGKQRVVQKGEQGEIEKKILVAYEDGKELSREVVEENIVKEAKDKVIEKGTKKQVVPKPKPAQTKPVARGGGRSGKAQTFTATAYTHTGNKTATGVWPKVGMIAVDPKVIPLGSTVYIEFPKPYSHLNGNYKATDRGGAIKGNKIDIFFDTKSECTRFGRKSVKVYFNR